MPAGPGLPERIDFFYAGPSGTAELNPGPAGRALGACILVASVMLLVPIGFLMAAGPQPAETASAQDKPVDEHSALNADLKEEVEVRILQLEVTAWPKSREVNACRDLKRDDFEVLIGGQPRDVLAADRLGNLGEPASAPPAPETDSGSGAPMRYVVVFDTWHLDLWWRVCGRTMPLAFSWVREMLQDRFQPVDRLMLATLSNLPQFYTPWLDNREAALQALEEMEVDPRLLVPHRDHATNVARADVLRRATCDEQVRQTLQNLDRAHASLHVDCQAFPGVLIDNR